MDMERRVVELEMRLAFQDDTIQSLNDVLVEQQRHVEQLQLQVAALAKRQQEINGQFEIAEDDAPPPHY
ncbi:SlyX family protein [Pseudomonas sp. EL_65y_Pfl2_R95]|uniref:SlyX family protein n=1 Tax=Pseudomonas sp. EL_65y_Pfl2_R95 TaxID=3088698 RepID=UPI0030DA7B01